MDKIAIFPGSFDPITKGHESVIKRALPLFDKIIISIGINSSKKSFFNIDERIKLINAVFAKEPKISIDTYEGLTVDYCKKKNARYILRGLRTSADFEYERSIAQMNKAMMPDIENIFLLTTPELTAINSTIVRDVLFNKGDITPFVPSEIIKLLKK